MAPGSIVAGIVDGQVVGSTGSAAWVAMAGVAGILVGFVLGRAGGGPRLPSPLLERLVLLASLRGDSETAMVLLRALLARRPWDATLRAELEWHAERLRRGDGGD